MAGAPQIDPKRPYGNGDVVADVADIIGIEMPDDEDDEKYCSVADEMYSLHLDMETVLQIIVDTMQIKEGKYSRDDNNYSSK